MRMNLQQLEKDLWEAADQLRANSKLTAAEYSMPILGLIFLRHANNRYSTVLQDVLAKIPRNKAGEPLRAPRSEDFASVAAIFLPPQATYDHLAALPKDSTLGTAIDRAMDAIEAEYPILQGALPHGYTAFEPDLLAEMVKIFNSDTLKQATGDVFGRIYEYFLNKFAQSGAQEGGEFFTPPSLVRLIVNVIEPNHGKVLDPACGSAGMFVQTGHFIEDTLQRRTNDEVTFYGQEKSDTNTRLARMNMVVHGLDASNIKQGNTFYDELDHLIGECDFVMANPPFNVDSVTTKKIESQVDEEGRLPFGLPGTNAKTGDISNANSLWIQYFYAYLNASGRAGFVMASSASDAGNKDKDIREKLVKTGHVDVMVGIGNKFFYTRSLPCTLWFFDKGKPDDLLDQVLMIDARHVYHVVSARSHVFTEEQLANLTAITWLYRGEQAKFLKLVKGYQQRVDNWLAALPERLAADTATVNRLVAVLDGVEIAAAEPEWTNLLLGQVTQARTAIGTADLASHKGQLALQAVLNALVPALKVGLKQVEARHKQALALLDTAEKTGKEARNLKRQLQAADGRKDEAPTVRDAVLESLKQSAYFIAQVHWLHQRFPDALFEDVPGLCKAVSVEEIAANDWSLTPGRYVGVAPATAEDDNDFAERMRDIHSELADLNDKAATLAAQIAQNFEELMA